MACKQPPKQVDLLGVSSLQGKVKLPVLYFFHHSEEVAYVAITSSSSTATTTFDKNTELHSSSFNWITGLD